MQRHGDEDESVLLHACTALTNLMHNSLENRSRFLEHAGVDLLVRMMDAHKASATIQRQICWTILTLAGTLCPCDVDYIDIHSTVLKYRNITY